MIPDRAGNAAQWEFDKLVVILLRQFKRLLAERGVELTDADMQHIGAQVVARQDAGEKIPAIRAALAGIVDESVGVLAGWKLTFAQSLATDMNDMPGWETTADFLSIANDKVNAEVRISAGTALMVALGDARNAHFLIEAVEHDLKALGELDVDAVIAKRALTFAMRVDDGAAGEPSLWLAQVKAWVERPSDKSAM